jgi:hypothetical protein
MFRQMMMATLLAAPLGSAWGQECSRVLYDGRQSLVDFDVSDIPGQVIMAGDWGVQGAGIEAPYLIINGQKDQPDTWVLGVEPGPAMESGLLDLSGDGLRFALKAERVLPMGIEAIDRTGRRSGIYPFATVANAPTVVEVGSAAFPASIDWSSVVRLELRFEAIPAWSWNMVYLDDLRLCAAPSALSSAGGASSGATSSSSALSGSSSSVTDAEVQAALAVRLEVASDPIGQMALQVADRIAGAPYAGVNPGENLFRFAEGEYGEIAPSPEIVAASAVGSVGARLREAFLLYPTDVMTLAQYQSPPSTKDEGSARWLENLHLISLRSVAGAVGPVGDGGEATGPLVNPRQVLEEARAYADQLNQGERQSAVILVAGLAYQYPQVPEVLMADTTLQQAAEYPVPLFRDYPLAVGKYVHATLSDTKFAGSEVRLVWDPNFLLTTAGDSSQLRLLAIEIDGSTRAVAATSGYLDLTLSAGYQSVKLKMSFRGESFENYSVLQVGV